MKGGEDEEVEEAFVHWGGLVSLRKTDLQRRLQKKTRLKKLLARAQIGPTPRVQTVWS